MFNYQQMFSNQQALAAADADDLVYVGKGDAGKSMLDLQVIVGAGASGALKVTISTGSLDDGSDAAEIASFSVPADKVARGGDVLNVRLPTGCKEYLKLSYSGATGGTVTAGIVFSGQTNGI